MLHKQSPRPGAFWAPRPGAGGMILPVQSPNSASRRTKKLPPPMAQTQKTAGPGAICSGACCHFLWKKIMLSGALRRLFFVHSLCGDYDDAHRFLLSTEIGRSTKCSAYVADISGLFACQLTCIHSFLA